MPTIASSVVPPPKAWDEFEDITLAAAKLRWRSGNFVRHGRTGQKQDGVDIYGHDEKGRHIGVQCKNTIDGVSLKIVKEEIAKAEAFQPALEHLCIATTAKRDASLQESVRALSEMRRKTKQFIVEILFWDDILQDLVTDEGVFGAHFPQFRIRDDEVRAHDKALFDQITTLLRSDGIIGFLDKNNMAGWSFREGEFEPLREFYYEWNRPEREFLSPELERLRKELWVKIECYVGLLAKETFPTNNPDRHSVPEDWESTQPDRFWRVVKEFHSLAGEIVALHREFVRTGKAQLIGRA